ncbi:hypothetical protein B7463_g10813, partial [Scytalidium lignicola]
MSLTPEETTQYSGIIDGILATADLNTISAKQIRKGLQAALDHDIAEQKQAVQALILERFDKFTSEHDGATTATTTAPSPPVTNGHATEKTSEKRQSHTDTDDGSYENSSPKKKRKAEVDDAKLAAMLQAQENNRARPTRGGVNKKAMIVRKKTPKKKSATKVKSADDSDLELGSDGEPKEVTRKGGFHKKYNLSAPLAELVGESTLSRPQVVKKIWEYIKERDLQDPADKRQIICDHKMQDKRKESDAMASTPSPAPTVASSSNAPSDPQLPARIDGQRGGRSRGRGRGRGGHGNEGRNGDSTGHTDSRGGRRGRGRGGNRAGTAVQDGTLPAMNTTDLAARFLKPQQQDPATAKTKESTQTGEEEDADDVCFICASTIVHHSVAPCNHRTCHICGLRMRALYKTKDCAHCRTSSPFVIFTDDANKRYEEYSDADIVSSDSNIGIRYEKVEIVEDTLLLLRYNCPDSECDVACLGWPDLHRHVRSAHHKKMCDLCTRHKKVFTHEHELFTDKELDRHMKKGDDNPGAIDQSGFKGHPLCGFCGQRFYGDDELYVHCREKHERCFICDRRGGQPQYYVDYNSLEAHFRKDHFLCIDRECLEKKFIVFPSEMDLKAHQLEEHGNSLSKDVRRDARIVDISAFDYRAPYVQERRGGGSQREGRGRGRGRDPNSEPIPPSSAQPLRRDEQVFQRQMAIHSAQSVSTRNFGGQLTAAPTAAARPSAAPQDPPSISVPRPSGNVEAITDSIRNMEMSRAELTPQELARQVRHRAVIERAGILLQNDESKMNQFRSSISSFKTGAITATGLIDSFFALFSDTSSNAIGTLIREVADLYEDKSKADTLRTAWNDWRAINEDYPSLPGPSGLRGNSQSLGWAGVTALSPVLPAPTSAKSTRVLKLKSSTAQSSRSSVSKTQSWGGASAPGPSGSAFPSLPTPAGASSSSRSGASRVGAMPWANSSSAPSSNPTSARPTPPTSRPASRGLPSRALPTGSDAFPALPPAAKPQSTIFGYGTGMVRRDGGKSAGNAWAGSSSADINAENNNNIDGAQGKRKGNKGKKQVLMNWG